MPFDGGLLTPMITMGHEMLHTYDDDINHFGSKINLFKNELEPRAVSFENYLRETYSLTPLRERYDNIKGNFHQFRSFEKITNFTNLGNNSSKTNFAFSYNKTITIVDSYDVVLGVKIPKKTRKETKTYYMIVSRDKDNNLSYTIYNNEKDIKKIIENW